MYNRFVRTAALYTVMPGAPQPGLLNGEPNWAEVQGNPHWAFCAAVVDLAIAAAQARA